jgi:fructose-1,6-bisphosphatase/inositol monophosphatase family enzyme
LRVIFNLVQNIYSNAAYSICVCFLSAAIMLSWLACGRVTSYFEADMNVWDLAAGCLLVKEAGGRVTDVWGGAYELQTRNLVASNGKIHDELLSRLLMAEMWMKDEDEKPRVSV